MLYVSTTSITDSFTAHRTLHQHAPGEGGLFAPMRLPVLSASDVRKLIEQPLAHTLADVLNLFFTAKLTGTDVEKAIGGGTYRIVSMSHKLYVGELWRNPSQQYGNLEEELFALLAGERRRSTLWAGIAIRIAVIFGVFGALLKTGVNSADIALRSGDFCDVMAAWYARKMGLPINTIVICCSDSGGIWELMRNGELSAAAINRSKSKQDAGSYKVISLLIYEICGREEVQRYLNSINNGEVYRLDPQIQQVLFAGMECAVVRGDRAKNLIRSIYRTHHYIAEPYTAMAHAALQEYRATAGESCAALMLSDASPLAFADLVGSALGLTSEEVKELFTQP